jgi:hypothetical protein
MGEDRIQEKYFDAACVSNGDRPFCKQGLRAKKLWLEAGIPSLRRAGKEPASPAMGGETNAVV